MDYNYLVPANSKKQGLVFGLFTPIDLAIISIGAGLSFFLLLVFPLDEVWGILLCIFPAFLAAFLVFPIPNYHNSRIFLREMYRFYFVNRRKYVWRGWCYKYEQSDE